MVARCHYCEEGQVYGRLTCLASDVEVRNGMHYSLFRCACGKEKIISNINIVGRKSGRTTSCGCFQKERAGQTQRKHGRSCTKEWSAWCRAKTRCSNPSSLDYPRYGGRGIQMCSEWAASFEAFFTSMGPCPDGCSLDRIDFDKGYEPGNCRWADQQTQSWNTSRTRWVEFNGVRKPLTVWASENGIGRGAACHRLKRTGDLLYAAGLAPSPKARNK